MHTGLFQPCDVAMQKPYKQAIKQAQLELAGTAATMLWHLSLPQMEGLVAMKLAVVIGAAETVPAMVCSSF
jgi:hypothetical protein